MRIYLTIDGIQGESTFQTDAIDVLSCSFNVAQAGLTQAGGKGSPARSAFSTLTIYKAIDKSTPAILLACALGRMPVANAIARLHFVDTARTENQDYFQIALSGVLISGYNVSSDTGGATTETVSLSYSTIELDYTQNLPSAAPKKATFDVIRNRPAPEINE